MALTKGINVYVDDALAAADAYFLQHVSADKWGAFADNEKSNFLVTGTAILDSKAYTGVAANPDQLLAFPRTGEYFDVRLGSVVTLDGITYPTRIVHASFEMALHLGYNPDLLIESGSVQSLDIKGIALTDIRAPELLPGVVRRLIQPLLETSQQVVWRAN